MNSQVPISRSRGVGLQSRAGVQSIRSRSGAQATSAPDATSHARRISLGRPLTKPQSVASVHGSTAAPQASRLVMTVALSLVARHRRTGALVNLSLLSRKLVANPQSAALAQRSAAAPQALGAAMSFILSVVVRQHHVSVLVNPNWFGRRRVALAHLVQVVSNTAMAGTNQIPPPNLTLKRNANSAPRRPSSAGPCGPFCARCPARHAAGVRLALR